MNNIAIELRGIDKSFGLVHANRNINLRVRKGTIHGIIGENGAGKSTLMSILYGFYQADNGEILVDGKPVSIRDPNAAISVGIGMVHQHFMLVENFTVLENVMLGAEDSQILNKGIAKARQELKRLEKEYALEVNPDALIEELPVGLQQRVEILKALYRRADILILDEPTGVLTPAEADHLFRILGQLKAQGKTIILITHKLREIMAITDEVSVMRRGEMVATRTTRETSVEELAELMVGRRVLLRVEKGESNPGDVKLAVQGLTVKDSRGVTMVDNVSFEVRAGEIVGIAGVAGNGQSELLEAIAGIRKAASGTVLLNGRPVDVTGNADAAELRGRGLAHVPEDRHHVGLVLKFEECENAILGYHHDPRFANGMFLNIDAIRKDAEEKIAKYDIRPPNARLRTANFSGGNQQKVVLAREMERDPDVLIIGQPTRGVDVGAIEFIHKRIIEMRDQGKAVLLVSVELDEIRSLSDRILVMFAGRVVGERSPEATEGELGLLMAGVEGRKEAAE
ncbi:ATP-binding cassette domain-containing protein [Sinorhizobium meliloti]|jgi:general nucleoside transport system ATP-binding protein|uniref:ABC transporter ATP-binding protein n=2 Tax=Sinorhizobium TaxID=28105 RepID=A0ABY8T450_9HYPH|nr:MULTISPECIES: ABC transporter ATP-binding protein [Sinorhizobium]ASQ05491.1 ABC transporter ATP-binding protein [Sinorhizobium meliloti]MCO6422902.1 ABC transporter ATP-binding protein [Sinorhizobium meliloti]MDW9411057.1 ATP-binding cassette domain-containing protein [Sinorhizobium meliloti]MDW9443317.1 ATP-binding cassette domain-containing protein [Sinorhizobium meliloti]MDW9456194.1 ATP-binding cassette domain-containing protein [Sinorhizobium meliloti]